MAPEPMHVVGVIMSPRWRPRGKTEDGRAVRAVSADRIYDEVHESADLRGRMMA